MPLRRGAAALALAAVLAALVLVLAERRGGAPDSAPPGPRDRPVEVPQEGWATSSACRSCHPHQYETWHASFHRTMTQVATPESALAPFDGRTLELGGRQHRPERRGDELWMVSESPGGADRREERVVLATGSHHFQAYWSPTGEGRKLRLLDFCWFAREGRWMPMDFLVLSPEGTRQTSEEDEGRWNRTCNRCHTTGSRPRLFQHGAMDTQVVEFGIACEACHGPGAAHADANRDPERRYRLHLSRAPDATIVNPASLPKHASAQACGQCHSVFDFHDQAQRLRWAEHGFAYRPGDELEATRKVLTWQSAPPGYRATVFWPDGQVRVNGREYNSLLETPCFQRGELTCLSCHALHQEPGDPRPRAEWADDQLRPGMRGNAACVQCHAPLADARRLAAHTFHAPSSPGSDCYNCHMPNTVWGLHKATRVHQVTSPDARRDLAAGRPNACNLCHLDRPLAWTARHLEARYGTAPPPLGFAQRAVAEAVLWALAGEAGQRALAAWHMGWEPAREAAGGDWAVPYLAQLLVDPYPTVRAVAFASLRRQPGFESLAYDFAGPAEAREGARRRALEIWNARRGPSSATSPALLLDSRGRLRGALFEQLLRQRDDRTVYLAE
jgi:hypothetical protein